MRKTVSYKVNEMATGGFGVMVNAAEQGIRMRLQKDEVSLTPGQALELAIALFASISEKGAYFDERNGIYPARHANALLRWAGADERLEEEGHE